MHAINPAMSIDLYELSMAESLLQHSRTAEATFSLFIREYPPERSYFVSAGLADVLDFLETFHYNRADLEYLDTIGRFSDDFLHYLAGFNFSGGVRAVPEGRLFFKDEPVLEVTAPFIEAQLAETFILNTIHSQSLIATKASRCTHAAGTRRLLDFSLRRTHGTDAGLAAARSSYIAGFHSTSNVAAGCTYGIPVSGTMAHSFITSFMHEDNAFRSFAETFPEQTVLLIDTYDTITGACKAAQVGRELIRQGYKLLGVRLDSGDISELSTKVRSILDSRGLSGTKIFASGGMDEYAVAEAIQAGAPIDGFGIGTKMGVSADAPYTDLAYKLVVYDNRPVLKLSDRKKTLPGEKQVFRITDGGAMMKDILGLRSEEKHGERLLQQVMVNGRRTSPPEPVAEMRSRFMDEFACLDESCKALRLPALYTVELSAALQQETKRAEDEARARELEMAHQSSEEN